MIIYKNNDNRFQKILTSDRIQKIIARIFNSTTSVDLSTNKFTDKIYLYDNHNHFKKVNHACTSYLLALHMSSIGMTTRLTRNQQSILELLEKFDSPISAQNLYVQLRSSHQSLGLATVYRSLNVLKLRRLVQSRTAVNGESLYSLMEQHQHYVTCLRCNSSIPVDSCPVCELEAELAQSLSFKIYYHTFEFFGLCTSCQLQVPLLG